MSDLSSENKLPVEKNRILPGVLYLVATPIGNMADLSERAVKVLSGVDFIAAEDTRNSGLLLSSLGIRKPLISYFEHNKRERGEIICARLTAGESCALITDAGTPAISDPGEDLVRLCVERGITVTSVPGCCAGITALTLSGLSTGRFSFEGFLPVKGVDRRTRLDAISKEQRTVILYEAPHRLADTLADLAALLGHTRRISLCRELTKLNEEVMRTTLGEAVAYYQDNQPRGEYVLVLEGADMNIPGVPPFWEKLSIPEHVSHYIQTGLSKNEAIKAVAKDRGVHKSEIYKVVIDL